MPNGYNNNKRRTKEIIKDLEKSIDDKQLKKDMKDLTRAIDNFNSKISGVKKERGTAKFYPEKTSLNKQLNTVKSHEEFRQSINRLNGINRKGALTFTKYNEIPVTNYEKNLYTKEKKKENDYREEMRKKSNNIDNAFKPVRTKPENIEQLRKSYEGWQLKHSQSHKDETDIIYGEQYLIQVEKTGNTELYNKIKSVGVENIYDLVGHNSGLEIEFVYSSNSAYQDNMPDAYIERLSDNWDLALNDSYYDEESYFDYE